MTGTFASSIAAYGVDYDASSMVAIDSAQLAVDMIVMAVADGSDTNTALRAAVIKKESWANENTIYMDTIVTIVTLDTLSLP
eukprot:CFRG7793T1